MMQNIEISEEAFKLLCDLRAEVKFETVGELVEWLAEQGANSIGVSIESDSDEGSQEANISGNERNEATLSSGKTSHMRLNMKPDDRYEELSQPIPELDEIIPTVLTEFRSRDLVNVEMVKAYVDGKPFYHKRWNQTLFHVIELLLGKGVSIEEIVEKLNGFATVGENRDDYHSYNEELDISHKIQNPKFVWPLIENLSRFWEVDVEIQFKWEQNARLELRGLSAELKTNRPIEHDAN